MENYANEASADNTVYNANLEAIAATTDEVYAGDEAAIFNEETPHSGEPPGDGKLLIKVGKGFKIINPLTDVKRYPLNDIGAGNLFFDTFKDVLRYVYDVKKWYFFNGIVWEKDSAGTQVSAHAKRLIAALVELNEPALEQFVNSLTKQNQRVKMIRDAESVDPISIEDFDTNPMLFNCLDCTIDFATRKTHKHDPNDMITKKANVNYKPGTKCERWDTFINEVMNNDYDLVNYLQRILGYALTGETKEETLFILYGPTTRNGKGTTMETISYLLGDYSAAMQPASLSDKGSRANNPSGDIARLAGVRFVNVSELEAGMKLNAAKTKQLTGGDTVTARLLYGNLFEYRPQFKLFINTNHLPEIYDDTLFASNRIRLIPFDRHFDEENQDNNLKDLFRQPENISAIFNWLIMGYGQYLKQGLIAPGKALKALEEYRQSADTVNLFIESQMDKVTEPGDKRVEPIKTGTLYSSYQQFCRDNGTSVLSLKHFISVLRRRNMVVHDRTMGNCVRGYILKDITQ